MKRFSMFRCVYLCTEVHSPKNTHKLAHRDAKLAGIAAFGDTQAHGSLLHELEFLQLRVELREQPNLFLLATAVQNILCSLPLILIIQLSVLGLILVVEGRYLGALAERR